MRQPENMADAPNERKKRVKLEAALRELAETWRRERDFLATGGSSDRMVARMYDDFASMLLEKIEDKETP